MHSSALACLEPQESRRRDSGRLLKRCTKLDNGVRSDAVGCWRPPYACWPDASLCCPGTGWFPSQDKPFAVALPLPTKAAS